jgi:hypothetical protein
VKSANQALRSERQGAPAGTDHAKQAINAHIDDLYSGGGITAQDSLVYCWGDDSDGKATPPDGTFVAVTAANDHSCGIRTSGKVACWGKDEQNQASPPSGVFRH